MDAVFASRSRKEVERGWAGTDGSGLVSSVAGMAKRVLAIVGAIAIVLAAMALRAAWTDDGDSGGSGQAAGSRTVACDPDPAAASRGL